jgi:streptomycin 6-kinase
VPSDYLQKARYLRDQLLQSSEQDALLHGDLHHDNILQNGDDKSRRSSKSEDGWVVIDPKGVIGERAYEVAAFIRNPMPDLLTVENVPGVIQKRIGVFSEILSIPSIRITAWCFVQAVLAWVWAIEDSCDTAYYWARFVDVLSSISEVLPM